MHHDRYHSRSTRRAGGRRSGLIATLLLAIALPSGASAQGSAAPILVMPFDNSRNEPKLVWLAEGSAIAVAEFLRRYGGTALPREERLSAFERLQLPPAAALSHATVIKVGQFVRAGEVVIGSYELSGQEFTIRARVLRLDAGRMTDEIVERGPLHDLFGLYDRVARRIRGGASPAPPPAAGTLFTSNHAFELYVKGLVAESAAAQHSYLEQAAKAAPADDRIRLALWHVHTDAGRPAEALAIAAAVPSTSRHAPEARYLTARSQIALKRYDEALNTLKELESSTRAAAVLNAMGVVQLRRGATAQSGRAVYFFSQASQLDPADPDYFFNLGYGYWLDKDPQAAIYWLREAVRRDPADGEAHLVLAAALEQGGATAEATRERELAMRLTTNYDPSGKASSNDGGLRGLERLKEHLDRRDNRVNAILASVGQRDNAELATHHLEAGRRALARELDRDAERDLRRALYLSPYLAEAHQLLGRVFLRTGRIAEAIQSFKIALWSESSVSAHLGLAEAYLATQNIDAARDEVEKALALDPSSEEARSLRAKIGQ